MVLVHPTNVAHSLSVATLVAVGDGEGGRHFGRPTGFHVTNMSLTWRYYARAVKMKKKTTPWINPSLKSTLAILIGWWRFPWTPPNTDSQFGAFLDQLENKTEKKIGENSNDSIKVSSLCAHIGHFFLFFFFEMGVWSGR